MITSQLGTFVLLHCDLHPHYDLHCVNRVKAWKKSIICHAGDFDRLLIQVQEFIMCESRLRYRHIDISELMNKPSAFLSFLVFALVVSCSSSASSSKEKEVEIDTKAQAIVDRAIKLHGGDLFKQAEISFTFREKRHYMLQDDKSALYQRSFVEDSDSIKDVYENGEFTRFVNGEVTSLSGRRLDRAIEDVNAVSYFATLPYKLNDPAVIKEYIGVATIKEKPYEKIKVTFEQEGGGHSPDNVFYYWFDQSTGFLEYLAYSKGGNRFRSAYNHRTINGIHFVDYVNYNGGDFESEDASTYDKIFDEGGLKELSRIILEDVSVKVIR